MESWQPEHTSCLSTYRNYFTVRYRRLQHVVVTGRGRPGCRPVQPGGILGSTSWAGCCAARAKLFCRSSYYAMAPELVVEHNLCRLRIMATVVATVHRPVRTAYACTTTPLSFLWRWNKPSQVSYGGGEELGAIKHLGDIFFHRPGGLPPPDQQDYHLDPSRLLNTPRVSVRRGDATPVPFYNPIPRLGVKINLFHMDAPSPLLSWMAPPTTADSTLFSITPQRECPLGPTRLGSALAARSYLNHRALRSISNVVALQARLWRKAQALPVLIVRRRPEVALVVPCVVLLNRPGHNYSRKGIL